MLVEEVPKNIDPKSSTIYFSSSINLSARRYNSFKGNENASEEEKGGGRKQKSRAKVNYNVTHLINAQTQVNDEHKDSSVLKSSQQLQIERLVSSRVTELTKETTENSKNLAVSFESKDSKKGRIGNTPSTKKILSARRTLNSYFEEERNVLFTNSILSLNYQFVDQIGDIDGHKNKPKRRIIKTKLKLCCVCGNISNYARCIECGLYSCTVKCNKIHLDMRCR